MATAPTIDDIIRMMREQPEARDAVRREILTDELLALPDLFATLTRRVDTLTERVDKLTEHMAEMDNKLGVLLGDRLERRAAYRLPPLLSQRLGLRRARAVYPVAVPPSLDLSFTDRVEEAMESGLITEDQESRLKLTDLVMHARRKSDGARIWFAVEASGAIAAGDIERAAESAAALQVVFDEPAKAVVLGHRIRFQDHERARQDGVVVLMDDEP